MLAFSRVQGRSREIRLLDVAAGTSERLTNNEVEDHDPVFTPDGEAIIWVEGTANERELMRMELATGNVDSLTDDEFNDVDPAVSPDGTRLAFVSNRESGEAFELFVMDLSTRQITRLLGVDDGDIHDPAWSPGGRFLVFSAGPQRDRDIFIFDTISGDVITVTSNPDNDLAPAWR
jgi:Tol biopolymer transport system component